MWNRFEVKHNGLMRFKANFWPCVVVALILGFTTGGGSTATASQTSNETQSFAESIAQVSIAFIALILALAIAIMLLGPLKVGCRRFFLVNQLQPAEFENVKFGFTSNYKNIVIVEFMTSLFIGLWTLLLIVPGIIKSYEFRMVDYILCENPDMDYREAQARSKSMMMGHKMEAFMYDLSFIGWYILGVCTCGLALLFYVNPYKASSDAALYIAIRNCSDVMSSYQAAPSDNGTYARDIEFEVESEE